MLAMNLKQRRPRTWSMLLSLLFVTHFFCAAGAMDTAATAGADGSAAVAGAASAITDAPVSHGSAEEHHLCQADSSVSGDQRATAIAKVVLSDPGGTALLRAPVPRAIPWRSPTAAAVPWSGTRLLFSLGVQRV